MSSPVLMRVMALSINTAKRAGEVIRDIMHGGNLQIVEKAKDDLQTEADRSAERLIVTSLSRQFPKVAVIGEESGSNLLVENEWVVSEMNEEFLGKQCPPEWQNVKEEDMVVWVDPLDGTSEYTQGFLDHVTVLIGVAINNSAVGGVIHQPYYKNASGELGRTIWGLKGLGTGGFEAMPAPKDQFIVTTTRSHFNPVVQSALEALKPSEVIKVGGAGFKVLQVLEGKAHAYVFASPGCKKWDTCAPEAVLEAAGGCLTDMMGSHYSYAADVDYPNSRGVLATIGGVSHADIVGKIPKDVIEAMSAKKAPKL